MAAAALALDGLGSAAFRRDIREPVRRRGAPVVPAWLLAAAACAAPADAPPAPAPRAPATPPAQTWCSPFAVRGRLAPPVSLTWRALPEGGPVDGATLRGLVQAAADAWSADGSVRFRPAADDEPADVTLSWHRAADDPCRLFGYGVGVAHTGPVGPGTFVHLDAARTWPAAGADAHGTLASAVAHELGHVLGLDHAEDPDTLMHPDTHRAAPAAGDWAGLRSLYGGGADGPGDVFVERLPDGARAGPALRGVAPPAFTELALFDTNGDGADELLMWRTDPAGLGALTIHSFAPAAAGEAPGPRLVRSLGPLLDLVPVGDTTALRHAPDGRRWIVSGPPGARRVRGFDERGLLRAPGWAELRALDVEALLAGPGPPVLRATGALPGAAQAPPTDGAAADELAGDLDGDGRQERVRRLAGCEVTVQNVKQRATEVELTDRIPVSRRPEIQVSFLDSSHAPQVDKAAGTLRRTPALGPGATGTISHAVSVESPVGRELHWP